MSTLKSQRYMAYDMVYSRWQYDMSCMYRTGTWHLVYDKWYMVCRKLNRMYVVDGIMCCELDSGIGESIKMQMQSQVFGRHIHRWVVGREILRENVSSVCTNVYATLTLARENLCWGNYITCLPLSRLWIDWLRRIPLLKSNQSDINMSHPLGFHLQKLISVNRKSSSQSSKLRISLAGFKGNGLFIRGDDATNVNTAWP